MTSLDHMSLALSDPTGRAILPRPAKEEATVSELKAPFNISQPSISRHLKILEDTGLISARHRGIACPRCIEPAAFVAISEWRDSCRFDAPKPLDWRGHGPCEHLCIYQTS